MERLADKLVALVACLPALGAVAGGLTADRLGNYSALLCSALLLPVFILLLVCAVREGKTDRGQ